MSSLEKRAHHPGPFEKHEQQVTPALTAAVNEHAATHHGSTEHATPRSATQHSAAAGVLSHWGESPAEEHGAASPETFAAAPHTLRASAAAASPSSGSWKVNHAVQGGHRNVDMGEANLHNRSHYTKGGVDPNRFAMNGHPLHLRHDSPIMADNGQVLGNAHKMKTEETPDGPKQVKQEVRINAGEIRQITPADGSPALTCVLAFGVSGHSGWVDVHAFDHAPALASAQRQIGKRLTKLRGEEEDGKHGHAAVKVQAVTAATLGIDSLFTMPHQTDANHAQDYCARPGNVVNLLVNLPATDNSRVGVAGDVIAAGADFHRIENVGAESVPLWTAGRDGHKTGKSIVFVYGYVERPGQPKRFGWINKEMVPGV